MNAIISLESHLKRNKRDLRSALYRLRQLRKDRLDGIQWTFMDWTYPHSLEVFNLLNPLYLAGFNDFVQVSSYEYIMVRDGFCSLVDFFYRFARPGGCRTILIIHERLACVVPEAWRKNVVTYNIQRKQEHKKEVKLPKSFYLCVLSFDWKTNVRSLREEISRIREHYGKKLNQIDFKIGAFIGGEPYYQHWRKASQSLPFLAKEICVEFGQGGTFYSWDEMVEEKDFHQSCYHYVAERYFVHAFSYIDHFFLSRRCMPFDEQSFQGQRGEIIVDMLTQYEIHLSGYDTSNDDLHTEIVEKANKMGAGGSLCSEETKLFLVEAGRKCLSGGDQGLHSLDWRHSQVLHDSVFQQ